MGCGASTPEATNIGYSDIAFGPKLAEGASKEVVDSIWSGQRVAVGCLKKSKMGGKAQEEFIKEARLLQQLIQHPNIIRLMGTVTSEDSPSLCVVLEFAERGSLFTLLHRHRIKYSAEVRWLWLFGIAFGLHHLHTQGAIAHRDMKSDNVLITRDFTPKLTDFGLSRQREGALGLDATTMTGSVVGSPLWMAPELMLANQYNPFLADVHSTSMIFYEIVSGLLPFSDATSKSNLIERVAIKHERPTVQVEEGMCPASLIELLSDMWRVVPTQRPRLHDVISRLHGADPTGLFSSPTPSVQGSLLPLHIMDAAVALSPKPREPSPQDYKRPEQPVAVSPVNAEAEAGLVTGQAKKELAAMLRKELNDAI